MRLISVFILSKEKKALILTSNNETILKTQNMKRTLLLATAVVTTLLAGCDLITDKTQPVDYVNNRIGNISHLLVPTYPTAQLPNSMLRMNPDHNEFTTVDSLLAAERTSTEHFFSQM